MTQTCTLCVLTGGHTHSISEFKCDEMHEDIHAIDKHETLGKHSRIMPQVSVKPTEVLGRLKTRFPEAAYT